MSDGRPSGFTLPRATAELALVAVHVSVVVGFDRLYRGSGYLGPLLAFVLGAHALAFLGRVRSVPAPIVAAVAVVAAVLTASWTLFGETTTAGIPSLATWHAARESLTAAHEAFAHVVAPVQPLDGFQLAAGLVLVGAVWFSDWAAFRLRTTVEAVVPAAVLFVFASLLGSGAHQWSSALIFTAAVLLFVAAHRALRSQVDQAWLSTTPAAGPRALLRAGGAVAVVALGAGVLVGPHLPGASADPVVAWRDKSTGGGSRITVSPLVEMRRRLVEQTDAEAFTVHANRPEYWRLTSLDRFDGNLWSSSGRFSNAGEELPTITPDIDRTREVTQTIEITGLSAIWVPVAYQATGLPQSSQPLRWDDDSSTLIVDADQPSSDGLTYTAVSQVPELRPEVLARDQGKDSTFVDETYSALPAGFPRLARERARQATAGAKNRYEQARMLQDWFRTHFRYSTTVSAGHSDDALVSFLQDKVGYCEQFAGAFAAMARSLDIPSRVAVGFTPGEADPEQPDTYHVLGRHAHAWPEVWFPSIGWVPFEPTPGRGIPDAQGYTGVPAAQDDGGRAQTPTITTSAQPNGTSTPASTTAPGRTTATTKPSTDRAGTGASPESDDPSSRSGPWAKAAVAVVVLVVAWLGTVLLVPVIRRRRHRRGGRDGHILDAWADAVAPVRWTTGASPAPAETYREFAARVADSIGIVGDPFRQLAEVVTRTSWSPEPPSAEDESQALDLSGTVRSDLVAHQSPASRLRRRLSWREALR